MATTENSIIENVEKRINKKSSLNRLLEWYVLSGVVLFLASGILFVSKKIEVFLSFEERLYSLVGGIGLTISAGAYLILWYLKQKAKAENGSEEVLLLVFLREWNSFENAANKRLRVDPSVQMSVRAKIEKLKSENIITDLDAAILFSSLQVRNRIVHSSDRINFETGEFLVKSLSEIVRNINAGEV